MYGKSYHSLSVCDDRILFTVLRCRRGERWRINSCRAICLDAEGSNGVCLYRAAGEGGGVLIVAVRALERDCVAAARRGFVVATFDAPLVSTSVGVSGVGGRADGTCWGGFLA
jgi:hypothetical protein